MNPSMWSEDKRDAIAQSLEDNSKFLGRQRELREFVEYMDSIDTMESKPNQKEIKHKTPTWITVLTPTLHELYDKAYYQSLKIEDREHSN